MMRRSLILLAPLALAACLSPIASNDRTSRVRLGQVANLGQVRVVPMQVIEDSRCAQGTQCVWAGQVRVRSTVQTPAGEHERTLTLGRPERIGGGTLLLQTVTPQPREGERIPPRDYTFVLNYVVPSSR